MRFSILIPVSALALSLHLPLSSCQPTHVAPSTSYCPPRPASPLEQQAIFSAYLKTFYVDHNISAAMNTYVAADLIQHNPDIGQGRAAQLAVVEPIFEQVDSQLQNVFFDDGFGVIYNVLTPKDKSQGDGSTAAVDIYRFQGSCMVEHWDVVQDVPAANATKSN